jgi:hypothetical protein
MTDTDAATIDRIATAVAARLPSPIPIAVDLWSSVELGAYFKKSPAVVLERIVPLPTFPRPIYVPSTRGRGHPRWKAAEVIQWAEQFQEKVPRQPRQKSGT